MKFSKHQQRQAAKLNKRFPDHLVPMALPPTTVVPDNIRTSAMPMLAWRSSAFVVVLWAETNGMQRLSINRADIDARTGEQKDGITWDELQRLKGEAGYHDVCAVEIYPPDADVVNVANMRHLWLLDSPPSFMWREGQAGG